MDGDKSPSNTFSDLYKFSRQIDTLLGIIGTADHKVRLFARSYGAHLCLNAQSTGRIDGAGTDGCLRRDTKSNGIDHALPEIGS